VVVFDSQLVPVVPALVPVTRTAMYLPFWVTVSLKVLEVAPLISRHDLGTFRVGLAIFDVHAYHLYE
jgi:hypothetical protein